MQNGDFAAERLHLAEQVRVDEDGDTALFKAAQDFPDLPPADGIDAVGGLIQNQNGWRMDQRLRQSQTLQHAFGIFADPHGAPLAQAHQFQFPESASSPRDVDARERRVKIQHSGAREVGREAMVFRQVPDGPPRFGLRSHRARKSARCRAWDAPPKAESSRTSSCRLRWGPAEPKMVPAGNAAAKPRPRRGPRGASTGSCTLWSGPASRWRIRGPLNHRIRWERMDLFPRSGQASGSGTASARQADTDAPEAHDSVKLMADRIR